MKRFLILIIIIFGAIFEAIASKGIAETQISGFQSPKREVRAVWLTTLGGLDWPRTKATSHERMILQQQELCDKLDRLRTIGINLVYLQTRVRGTVIYPSRIEPWDGALTGRFDSNPGYDPLEFAIKECHKRGMECHAWVVTIPCFKISGVEKLGKRSLYYTHRKLLFKQNDTYYMDPSNPETSRYLAGICKEIVSGYDVDGIHLDYIRYPENTPNDRGEWRRANITRVVRAIHDTVKAVKPWVRLSCSPVGKYNDVSRYQSHGWNAYTAVYQDAVQWMKEGLMDMISPMMYFKGDNFYPFCADWQEQSHGKVVAPGLGIYFLSEKQKNWNLVEITRELQYIRTLQMGGAAYFRAQFLLEDVKGLSTWLRMYYYQNKAIAAPPLDTPLPFLSKGTETPNRDGAASKFTASRRYVLYASKDFPVDINNPENIVDIYWGEPTYDRITQRVWRMNLAITELDAYGNESEAKQIQFK